MEQNNQQVNIECKLHRPGGTRAEIGGIEYHFAPQPDGAHVAGVADEAHVARFLSIPDAYRLYRGDAVPAGALAKVVSVTAPVAQSSEPVAEVAAQPVIEQPAAVAAPVVISTSLPESFDIGGKVYSLAEVSDLAREAQGMSADDWMELSDDTRTEFIEEKLDEINAAATEAPPAAPAPAVSNDADREALSAAYKAKFGKSPHYKWSTDKIREALAE